MSTEHHPRVLIVEPVDGMEDTYAALEAAGCDVIIGAPTSRPDLRLDEDELIDALQGVDALMGMARERVTRRVIDASPRLRIICKFGTGVDNIDVEAATERGVLVSHAPVHNPTVAEHAFTLMLSTLRRIPQNVDLIRAGGWRSLAAMGHELRGSRVGLVGFGGIGREFAKRLVGWDVDIAAYDPALTADDAQQQGVVALDLPQLLQKSDVVSVHVPLLPTTRHLIGEAELTLIGPSGVLINTSRGPLVDQAALIRALESGKLRGAGLDVFEDEPLSDDSELLRLDNVVISPHVGGYTFESLRRICQQSVENCLAALSGAMPRYLVNPEAAGVWLARHPQAYTV